MSNLRAEIEAVDRKLEECFASSDFAGLGNLYTKDVKIMAPGHSTLEGLEGATKALKSTHDASPAKSLKVVEEEIGSAGGDVIYSRGVFTMLKEDGTVADEGKFVALWKRVDGQLRMYTDIFNSNKS